MTEEDVYRFLTETFRVVFTRDIEVTPQMVASDVEGWDSFAQISIIIASEKHYGFQFTTEELDNLENVADFVTVILKRKAST